MPKDCSTFLTTLSEVLYELRMSQNETQADFAKKSQLHQSAIARIECGTSPNIGIKTLFETASSNNVSLSELIKRAEGFERNDEWTSINNQIHLLSHGKRKWLTRIVKDILRDQDS